MSQTVFIWEDRGNSPQIRVIPLHTDSDATELYRITVDYPEKRVPDRIKLTFYTAFNDIFGCWTPEGRFRHELMAYWRPLDAHSRSASGAPVFALYAKNGKNRCTFALSDVANPTCLTAGMDEPTGQIRCTIELFTNLVDALEHYETLVRIDKQPIPYYESIYGVRAWWTDLGYTPAYVPDFAKQAMFSSWYSFQKDITEETVLEQCRMAKEYGLDTLILDDGWQCDEVQTGYSYCGDWEAVPSKFPDMRRFVDRLHEMGMKCILWYSVPFVGIHAKNYSRFQGKYLRAYNGSRTVFVLDPRFADVRKWLVDTYKTAVRDWDLDGLKLDFIDSFSLARESSPVTDEMDSPSLETAVENLLDEIMTALRQIKPDIMIEFRQSYIGPVMQKYGNILRVGDCAGGALINRVSSIDLRLITGDARKAEVTAVHSDMLMWDYTATPEGAADQLAACLFCAPQISVMFDRLSEIHQKMLRTYLEFMSEHREVLLHGKLMPLYPEANYAQVLAENDGTLIAALYENPLLTIPDDIDRLIVVNATGSASIYVENCGTELHRTCTVKNCMGDLISRTNVVLGNGIRRFEVPHNGFLYLK